MVKILIVDDDAVLRNMYTQKLKGAGYEVVGAQDGEEAYEIFQKEKFDLVITDIMLPRVSGTEFLEKLRESKKDRNTSVIAWSNLQDEEEKEKALNLGAKEFLHKGSLTLDQVLDIVKKYT